MPADPRRIKDLFTAALDLPDPPARAAFVDRECAGDPDLRRRVDVLLAAHDAPEVALERPLVVTVDQPEAADQAGTIIDGKYKLLEPVGEGGMGEVWVADQLEPIRRRVALKLIKAGMDTKNVLARFEAERQALALMDHPNIAKVLDAGTTPDGRPFFAMELVKGTSITEFCDARKLTPRERLELFVPVCQAIQHAHQKGIIHRDIKPSNILVALHDERPVPKVIDFGVAKAVGQQLTEKTIYTGLGALVGTPAYMAPEQATFNQLDIDTRADVYALGVLLYELLAGSPPFEPARLKKAAFDELLRMVREEEPPRPSARLSTSEARASIAAVRQTDPDRLSKLMRGELDWIVMKALEKDRGRRYETANGFAQDVQRYLTGEAVLAHPPSPAYRLRKALRRNRRVVGAATAVILALVAGIVGTSLGLVRAERQRAAAEWERDEKDRARQAAEASAEEARQAADRERAERKQSDAVAGVVEAVFRGLNPRAARTDEASVLKQLVGQLDAAAAQLEHDYAGQPLVRARLEVLLGLTYMGLGRPEKAEPLYQAAYDERLRLLGLANPETLVVLNNLATAKENNGKTAESMDLLKQVIAAAVQVLGEESDEVLATRTNLGGAYVRQRRYAEAIEILERVRARHKIKPPADPEAESALLNNLASAYVHGGRAAEAIPLLEESLRRRQPHYPPDHPDTVITRHNLADAYVAVERPADAIPLLKEELEWQKRFLGADHPDIHYTLNSLASAYTKAGRVAESVSILKELRDHMIVRPGPDDLETLAVSNNLGAAYLTAGRFDDAIGVLEPTVVRLRRSLPEYHPTTLTAMNSLGLSYRGARRFADAIAVFAEVLPRRTKAFGPTAPPTLLTAYALAATYLEAGQFAKAEAGARELIRKAGGRNPYHFGAQALLGLALLKTGRAAEAEPILRDSLTAREKAEPDEWTTFGARSLLGGSLLDQRKYADAGPLLQAGYEGMKQREAAIRPENRWYLAAALDRLIRYCEATGDKDGMKRWTAERAAYPAPAERSPAPREVR
jgi:eukaryotic-like serine/threonine-protein kinase